MTGFATRSGAELVGRPPPDHGPQDRTFRPARVLDDGDGNQVLTVGLNSARIWTWPMCYARGKLGDEQLERLETESQQELKRQLDEAFSVGRHYFRFTGNRCDLIDARILAEYRLETLS